MPDPYDDGCLQHLPEVFRVGEMFCVVRSVPIIILGCLMNPFYEGETLEGPNETMPRYLLFA